MKLFKIELGKRIYAIYFGVILECCFFIFGLPLLIDNFSIFGFLVYIFGFYTIYEASDRLYVWIEKHCPRPPGESYEDICFLSNIERFYHRLKGDIK